MLSAGNVVAFLSPVSPAFDPSLMLVMAGAIGMAVLPFQTVADWHKARQAGVVSQVHLLWATENSLFKDHGGQC